MGFGLRASGSRAVGRDFRRAIGIALFAFLLCATSASAEIIDRIVAVVGGQIVTKSDVVAAAAFGLAADLQALVDRTLMLNEVRRVAPPDPAAAAVDARVARMRANFATTEAFAHALELGG